MRLLWWYLAPNVLLEDYKYLRLARYAPPPYSVTPNRPSSLRFSALWPPLAAPNLVSLPPNLLHYSAVIARSPSDDLRHSCVTLSSKSTHCPLIHPPFTVQFLPAWIFNTEREEDLPHTTIASMAIITNAMVVFKVCSSFMQLFLLLSDDLLLIDDLQEECNSEYSVIPSIL